MMSRPLSFGMSILALAGMSLAVPAVSAAQVRLEGTARAQAPCLSVTATVSIPNDTGNVAVNPKTGTIYAVGSDQSTGVSELYVISGQTNAVVDTIPLPGLANGVTVNPGTDTVYVTGAPETGGKGSITVIDGATNKVVATHPRGFQLLNTALDPAIHRMYVTNLPANEHSQGVLLILKGASYQDFVKQISIGIDAAAVGVDRKTSRIYIPSGNGQNDTVTVINGKTNTVAASIAVSTPDNLGDSGLTVNAVTNRIYVAGDPATGSGVPVINGATNKVIATIPVPGQDFASGVAVNTATNAVYAASWAASFQDGHVSLINGKTNSIVATATVGLEPQGIATDPATRNVYAVNRGDGTMSVLHDSCTA